MARCAHGQMNLVSTAPLKILEATLVEEKETDLALTSLAQQSVNVAAMA